MPNDHRDHAGQAGQLSPVPRYANLRCSRYSGTSTESLVRTNGDRAVEAPTEKVVGFQIVFRAWASPKAPSSTDPRETSRASLTRVRRLSVNRPKRGFLEREGPFYSLCRTRKRRSGRFSRAPRNGPGLCRWGRKKASKASFGDSGEAVGVNRFACWEDCSADLKR